MARVVLSLGYLKRGDVRAPVKMRLMVQDEETLDVQQCITLSEHEYALLMSGQAITVESDLD